VAKPRPARSAADALGDVMVSASRIQALYVAVRLGLPDLLTEGPRSSTLLASSTGVHPDALHRLMRFLVAEGYFRMDDDGRFALAPAAEPLTTRANNGMREYVLSTATRAWQVWGNLLHSIETGRPAFDLLHGESYFAEQQRNPESLARFDAVLAEGAAKTGAALAKVLPPEACVVDVGCGSGALLVELLQRWPAARGIAFDAAPVLRLAAARFVAAKVHERVECLPGDFFANVPAGGSLYALSLVLHDWDDDRALAILANCQAAMAPGSRLVIVERPVPDNPREAPSAAHADLAMLVMTGGRERTLAEYRRLLERAGLRFDGATPLPGSSGISAIMASRGLM